MIAQRSFGQTPAIVSVLGTLVLGACTHRQVVHPGDPAEVFAEATRTTREKDARILTREGQVFEWYDVQFRPDSTVGVVAGSGLVGARPGVPTDRIAEVTVRSRSRGAMEGAVIGAGLGAVLGAIAGPDEPSSWYDCAPLCADTRAEQALYGVFGGALWGVIIGAIRGTRWKILVRDQP
jgi:hypothetical protein